MQNQPENHGMTALSFEELSSVVTKKERKKKMQSKETKEEAQYLSSLMVLEGLLFSQSLNFTAFNTSSPLDAYCSPTLLARQIWSGLWI